MKNIMLTTIAMTALMTFTMLSACNSSEELPEGAAVIAETDIGIIEAMQTDGKDELEIVETSVTYEDEVMATDETFGTPNDSSTDTTSGTTTGAANSSKPTETTASPSETTATPTPTPSGGAIDMSNAEIANPDEQFYVLVGIDIEIWFEIDPDDDGIYEWTSEILHFDTSEYKNPKSQDCVAKLEDMGYTVVGVGNIQIVKSYSEPA